MRPTLAIDEGDEPLIPQKYHRINNLCAVIYDQLTEIYKETNYKPLSQTTFNLSSHNIFNNELKGGTINILDWLKHNELNDEIVNLLTKQIILAVVSDFLNFIFESLHCAKRGKMIVAYALLRKPITDELLIFEQLLGNKYEFIDRFYHKGNPEEFDPSNKNIDKKNIIKEAIKKLNLNKYFSEDTIFDFRYNKNYPAGLNGISNHALHIVTLDNNYKTSNQNLNFVFANEKNITDYFEHYYNMVPYLLVYSVSVIDELIFSVLNDEENQKIKQIKEIKRFIALLLFSSYSNLESKNIADKMFVELSKMFNLKCSNCGKNNKIVKADWELFISTNELLCSKCFKNLLLQKDTLDSIYSFLILSKN